jgi:hypothetical protein
LPERNVLLLQTGTRQNWVICKMRHIAAVVIEKVETEISQQRT